jgi:cyclopropane fatty-acyl-phospholipid synthase-like methyltransferase
MEYFDNEKNVQDYINMVEGYDPTELINILLEYLLKGSTLLELGMGPGKDLDALRKYYKVTGSDSSQIFINRYKKSHRESDIIKIDARDIRIQRKFDCIYSNKVLIHLTKEECQNSFKQQKNILNSKGLLFHTFWFGTKTEKHHDLLFTYYTEEELRNMVKEDYNIIRLERYTEDKKDDSILIILQTKDQSSS